MKEGVNIKTFLKIWGANVMTEFSFWVNYPFKILKINKTRKIQIL